MKKIVYLFLVIGCCLSSFSVKATAISTSAKSAILINADTLSVLYSQNADCRLSMASTTKIMTGLLLAEENTPEKTIKTTKEMVYVEGTNMGLKVGDNVTYQALLYGLLLLSGNDAANTVALSLSPDFVSFASLMNRRAQKIGMKNTNFVTPSGLDNENHYTTAYDMALLTATALKNELFSKTVSTKEITIDIDGQGNKRTFSNHNKLLRIYDGAIGVKTGFTKKSGRCLVSAAQRDGVTLIVVTLNDPDDWDDHQDLFDYGFSKSQAIEISPQIPSGIYSSADDNYLKIKSVETNIGTSLDDQITYEVYLPHFCHQSLSNDKKVGFINFYCCNAYIKTENIYLENLDNVENYNMNILQKIFTRFIKLVRSI